MSTRADGRAARPSHALDELAEQIALRIAVEPPARSRRRQPAVLSTRPELHQISDRLRWPGKR